ncbi:MAG: hypothetical protein ABL901_13850 [Hyphomicrobiaceae bacterium]
MARDIGYVLDQIDAGKTIKFYRDYYGRQKVEIRTAWIWRTQVSLPDHDIMKVREALQMRRRMRDGHVGRHLVTKTL